jgi:hypothetical protein
MNKKYLLILMVWSIAESAFTQIDPSLLKRIRKILQVIN